MKTAFASWENRIAPVFDTARELVLVECEGGQILRQERQSLVDEASLARALHLMELGVETLVCGAISRALHEMLLAYGIQVRGFVTGDLNEVIRAWFDGGLEQEVFVMPGCRGLGGYGRHIVREENAMPGQGRNQGSGSGRGMGRGQGQGMGRGMGQGQGQGMGRGMGQGMGQGQGQGQGQGIAGRGRQGGALGAGPSGFCLCPKCGHRQAHDRGRPCVEQLCPDCGTALIRS
ncbi:NifB/NifX family molybdenum-iron cluster-binding protein [Trichloromonas sp.]|uniref:NifB/NifX family molybdenum-iron cluster-binding protein n=1 Tax=Trichloromonas sp. TaxID=3069249 RepID=UPI002A4CF4BF|nr:NifB/NifX family molybdenum-iron cluster-binding protein [Trichloromonas sp.]